MNLIHSINLKSLIIKIMSRQTKKALESNAYGLFTILLSMQVHTYQGPAALHYTARHSFATFPDVEQVSNEYLLM